MNADADTDRDPMQMPLARQVPTGYAVHRLKIGGLPIFM